MILFLLLLLAAVVGLLILIPPLRAWLYEEIHAGSDSLVLGLLRSTSRFGKELTEDGKAEQKLWREQRLRNLRGLAIRSKEAASYRQSDKKGQAE
ncbi:MAG TPA: hypothetical protein VGA73_16630 [Candidatus Binatia bacterium]